MESPIIYSSSEHVSLIPEIVALHQACITQPPCVIATFLPPFKAGGMEAWWEQRVYEQEQGYRKIILQMAVNEKTGKMDVAGYCMLGMPVSQTGPFRGIVEKLLVSPEHRRKGIARRLMERLEVVAKEEGRTLLTLDTVTGSPAELIYPKLGYIQVWINSSAHVFLFSATYKTASLPRTA
ncbi:hypothetical protein BP5796_01483 [Coleophoma crateriformis]|uniref:N-acetyltransferase domain-containing protein n=1 Tax=Coleophoma crateriformis TaxID=565419 RepID=A0A3D8T0Q4_9HELO|nr:hypothetical protein BP5796_01483 [Coleophoma crateriformis]